MLSCIEILNLQEKEEVCYCCGKRVSDGEEKKRRRNLSNPEMPHSCILATSADSVGQSWKDTKICILLSYILIANLAGATPILPKHSSKQSGSRWPRMYVQQQCPYLALLQLL